MSSTTLNVCILTIFVYSRLTSTYNIYAFIVQIEWLLKSPYMRLLPLVNDFAECMYMFVALKRLKYIRKLTSASSRVVQQKEEAKVKGHVALVPRNNLFARLH